jgi:hypothetical protein
MFEGWNESEQDISFDIVGDGLPATLDINTVTKLKQVLPWAECAAPIIGASPSVKNGSEAVRNIGSYAGSGIATGGAPGISPGGTVAQTGNSGNSSGPHLDVRWKDGRPITTADIDRYVTLNGGLASSFRVTSGYGPRTPPKTSGGTGSSFHKGIDLGTPTGTAVGLTGGATVVRQFGSASSRTGTGLALEIQTPEGPMYLFHLSQATSSTGITPNSTPTGTESMPGVNASAIPWPTPDTNMVQPGEEINDYTGRAAVAQTRQQYSPELQSSATMEQFYTLIKAEVGSQGATAQQAFIETVFNRAGVQGQTINQIISNTEYYQPYQDGGFSNAAANLTDSERQLYQGLINNVLNGSNITGGATHNASAGVAASVKNGGYDAVVGSVVDIGGETFYSKTFEQDKIGDLAKLRTTATIQHPTQFAGMSGPNTNNQALGMFGYASEGTAVWVFFREGNPLFPVYFAASYGQREWQNMYQYSSPGLGAGDGGGRKGVERMFGNFYGGGFNSIQVTQDSGLEPNSVFQVYGKNGSNLTFEESHTSLNSLYDHTTRVRGDLHEIAEANREVRVRGDNNVYTEQDHFLTVGNWTEEAMAASDEIQTYINEAMNIKSQVG